MALKIGDQAPDFKLVNTERKEITLSTYRGKNVLILFFPFAFTRVCTAEMCSLRDNKKVYDDLDAVILSISVDSPHALAKYKETEAYNFEFLSDFNKEVSYTYDVLYRQFHLGLQGVSKRAAFVVDKGGKIRYTEILENAGELPNFAAINELLQSLT
ncbi:MAG: redoxin domain-containing protein [Saprospiraceae bacterium]|nr:redoxin domain-containing protein [Saprospiraceae bacterium]